MPPFPSQRSVLRSRDSQPPKNTGATSFHSAAWNNKLDDFVAPHALNTIQVVATEAMEKREI